MDSPPRRPGVEEVLIIPLPEAGASQVFSNADQGVAPPVLVRPKLTAPFRQENRTEGMSVVDLVVSETGDVESVKLASPVRDYREAMVLSSIKAWRFKPASADGYPVRYRMRIWLTVSPSGAIIR